MRPPKVTIVGHAYLVQLPGQGGHYSHHLVGKDKVCHTCRSDRCPAVSQVARYLKAGGERAPDPPPPPTPPAANLAASHRFWFVPEACPICGSPVLRDGADRRMDSPHSGPRWRCAAQGYEHFFQVRYGHLRGWLTRAASPAELQVSAIGPGCYEVALPDDGTHIVAVDNHGAVCFTCNRNDCAGVRHVRPVIDAKAPEPVVFSLPIARPEPAQVAG